MRLVLLLSLMITPTFSADLVTLRTKDGRSMTGYYDAEEGTLTTIKPKGMFRLKAHEIASITPVAAPEQTAAKADNNDTAERLKRRQNELEADRDKALATGKRYRMLAAKAQKPKDTELMEANAATSDAEVLGYQKNIDAIAIKLVELESDKNAIKIAEKKPQLSEIGQLRLHLQELQNSEAKAQYEVKETQSRLLRLVNEANRNFVLTGDLEPVAMATSARPTKEENERVMRISQFNTKLETLRGIRERWEKTGITNRQIDQRLDAADNFFGGNDARGVESFWEAYAEFKNKPAPY